MSSCTVLEGKPDDRPAPHRGFLAELLMAECEDRDRRRSERRIRAAGFPRSKWLSDFDCTANRNVTPALINNLATCE
jgi:DNA replication protein DnaC